jgi:hypothetical protein
MLTHADACYLFAMRHRTKKLQLILPQEQIATNIALFATNNAASKYLLLQLLSLRPHALVA